MKIRTLLLGTATAFAAATGAQAADLAVAEPVDYVKVCDAYGAGYFYIPGTDTCLKLSGYVKSTIGFYNKSATRALAGQTALTVAPGTVSATAVHPASWDWVTEVGAQVTAQSMTDIGLLTGFIDYRAVSDNNATQNNFGKSTVYMDSAYLKAGPMKLGYFTNIYMYGGDFSEIGVGANFDAADDVQDQLAFSTSMGGVGVWLGIADNRDGPGGPAAYKGNWPDVIAALTGSSGGFDWKWSIAATDTTVGTGWGTQLGGTFTFAGGDAIRVKATVGNGEGRQYVNNLAPINGGTWWSAFVGGVHYWSSNVSTEVVGEYSAGPGASMWEIGTETDWLVAKNFLTGIAFNYGDTNTTSSAWYLKLVGKRSW